MNNHTRNSFPQARRALIASAVVVLMGAAPTFAQSGGAGSSSYGSSQKSSTTDATSSTTGTNANDAARRNNQSQPTTATGSGYHSGTAGADVDSTREINARTAATRTDKLSWSDRRFVNKAADGGQAEVQLAQLAAQRASNSEVRAFAQKLVDDHSKVNSELMGLASQKGLTVDKDDDKDRVYKRLNKKSGMEFDEEFVEHMIDEHEKDVKLFEKAASDAKDSDLRSFASKHVGHLREHLQQAQSLRQTLTPTGRTDDRSGRSTPAGTTSSGLSTSSTGSTGASSSSTTDPSTSASPGSGTSATGSATTPSTGIDTKRRNDSR